MTPFATRAVVLFALAATIPVALTAIVWLAVSGWGAGATTSEAKLARTRIEELDAQRTAAVQRLCHDDLAVDMLLQERANKTGPELDYDRLFRGVMEGAGLDALWVVDSMNGEVVAVGHRQRVLGHDGTELSRRAREAPDRSFVLLLGEQEHQRFVVRACSIARDGARLTVVAGHRLSSLRSLDPDQIVITDAASAGDEVLTELVDSEGVTQSLMVWRPRLDRRAPSLLLWIACVAVLAVGLALFFGGYLNRWLQSSVDELTAAATRVGRGDFDTTLRDDAGGAFPATATAFNRMTRDLRNAQAQLRQTERIAAWQEIARSLAHELKNPLSPIRLSIETLRKAHARSHEEFDALFDESTRTILQEVERLRNIVDEFSRFARLPAPTLRKTDLREPLSQAASLHAEGAIPVRLSVPATPVEAMVDPDQITQVLHNLLQNARDAAHAAHPDGGGAVTVSVEQKAGTAYIHVEDNGPGIPADQAEAIFDPYYTRKEGGTGLGLAITQRIVTEHGGRIDVESCAGRTVFTVVLPGR
jgi:two-component system nitrogen regulation sensor histidine kinase NtrY